MHIFATSIRIEKPNDFDPREWHGARAKGNGKGNAPTPAVEGEKHKWASIARNALDGKHAQCKSKVVKTYSLVSDLWVQLDDDQSIIEAVTIIKQKGRDANAKGYPSAGSTVVKKSISELLRTTSLFAKHDLGSTDIRTTWPRDYFSPIAVVEVDGRRVLALAVKMVVLIVLLGGVTAPEGAVLKAKLVGVTNRPGFSVPWIVQWG